MKEGIVYSETVVHVPPTYLADEAPYQIAIIDVYEPPARITVRILKKASDQIVRIGDRVRFVEERGGVAFYAKKEEAS